jgi:hypothetical protein
VDKSFILVIHTTARVIVIITATFAICEVIHPATFTVSSTSIFSIVDIRGMVYLAVITPVGVIISARFTPHLVAVYNSEVIIDSADIVATLTDSHTFVANYVIAGSCFVFITYILVARYAYKNFFIFHIVSLH